MINRAAPGMQNDVIRAGIVLFFCYNRLEEQSRAKDVAAVKIQARWRGRIGRIEGRGHLKVRTACTITLVYSRFPRTAVVKPTFGLMPTGDLPALRDIKRTKNVLFVVKCSTGSCRYEKVRHRHWKHPRMFTAPVGDPIYFP